MKQKVPSYLMIIAIFFCAFWVVPGTSLANIVERELEPGVRAEIQAEGTAARKLQRGFVNMILSPFEISNELRKEYRRDSFPPSWFAGLGRGAGFAVIRAGTGIYEVLTFPFKNGSSYGPIIQPEFPWELLPEDE